MILGSLSVVVWALSFFALAATLSSELRSSSTYLADEADTSVPSDTLDITPDTRVVLGKAWIEEFFAYDGPPLVTQSAKNQAMKSAIKHYELNDLKKWTQKINSDTNYLHEDQTYKKYSPPAINKDDEPVTKPPQKLRDLGINIDRFIHFLIEKGGFQKEDLQFLKQEITLDYGLKEIEQELNKLKKRENEKPININIGGEENMVDISAATTHTLGPFVALLIITVLFI